MIRRALVAVVALATLAFIPSLAHAEAKRRPVGVGGYFRVMARPDFQGGVGRLGFWNLYGRLLNEAPWAALELRVDLLQSDPGTNDPWTSARFRIEGGAVANGEASNGKLGEFRVSQLSIEAGNVLLDNVTWRVGTLETYFGDLGLYDMRLAQIFQGTIGLSARIQAGPVDAVVGVGDSGFGVRGFEYSTILTAGGTIRIHDEGHFELGLGGEVLFEPRVEGNRFAPYETPGVVYDDFVRGQVVEGFLEENPTGADFFPKPVPTNSLSAKAIGYVGFGNAGPLRWNSLYVNLQRKHPERTVTETVGGRDYDIYTKALTDERYELNVGNELQVQLVPQRLDLAWGMLFGRHWDNDNTILPTDNDRLIASTVLRLQLYLTEHVHLLFESSGAVEQSSNGNRWRNHADSVFENVGGLPDTEGLEYGDSDERLTWQGKAGLVLNPLGRGIYTRPSIRILYGAQYSTMNNAFGNSFVETLSQYNEFGTAERHWHHVIAFEAEAWF